MIGILGGTFDPIHEGHLYIARFLLTLLDLDAVRMIPSFIPVHRGQPSATPQDRLAMVRLAIENDPQIVADTREIERANSSYMIDTLISLREELPHETFCLILGLDAFEKFDQWHRWQEIIRYCHFIIVDRHHSAKPYTTALQQLIDQHNAIDFAQLTAQQQGLLYFCKLSPVDISATEIRRQLMQGKHDILGLPPLVENYIIKHKIYVT